MRIVSLLPSATEIVYALERGPDLVGVTFECDFPANARADNAIVVGGRDTSRMTPREIDDYVHAAAADLYTLNESALAELAPDVILTQDLCRVCALPSSTVVGRARLPRLLGQMSSPRSAFTRRRTRIDPHGRTGARRRGHRD